MIVPPIYDKHAIIAARFSGLWTQAQRALQEATRVTLLGYSVPLADSHAANLLRRGVRSNSHIDSVRIVNPDPNLPGRVAELLGSESVLWFRDIASYTAALRREHSD